VNQSSLRHAFEVAEQQPKVVRVIVGIMLMAAFVLIALSLVTQYAGSWGVPYFSFTSERGSPCKNKLTGFTCSPLTLADLEFYGDVDLPDDSVMISGRYTATHDYQLDAAVDVPARSANAALAALKDAYGDCVPGHPSPLSTTGLRQVCVVSNDDAIVDRTSEPSSRLYVVGTGVRKDGSRPIVLTIKSR
jgi:hypothetical protein